jgi:hypothetical protein
MVCSVIPSKCRVVRRLGQDLFLPNPFQFINHTTIWCCIICDADTVVKQPTEHETNQTVHLVLYDPHRQLNWGRLLSPEVHSPSVRARTLRINPLQEQKRIREWHDIHTFCPLLGKFNFEYFSVSASQCTYSSMLTIQFPHYDMFRPPFLAIIR